MFAEDFKGLTFTRIDHDTTGADEKLVFETVDGKIYTMAHHQDCCECVYLDEIIGDLDDLINTPILLAREACSEDRAEAERDILPDDVYVYNKLSSSFEQYDLPDESETWTFYLFSTIKGSVTLRWYGSSNGYYSEGVDITSSNN